MPFIKKFVREKKGQDLERGIKDLDNSLNNLELTIERLRTISSEREIVESCNKLDGLGFKMRQIVNELIESSFFR